MTDNCKTDPDPRTSLVDRVEFHARSADHDLRSVRDEIERAGGYEAEAATLSRAIGVLFKLREKLRKPATPAVELGYTSPEVLAEIVEKEKKQAKK